MHPAAKYPSAGDCDVNGDGKSDVVLADFCVSNSSCQVGQISLLLATGTAHSSRRPRSIPAEPIRATWCLRISMAMASWMSWQRVRQIKGVSGKTAEL